MPVTTFDRRPTVQIVQGEPDQVRLLQIVLELAGFRVVAVASDCREALDQLRTIRPDVVLTDLQFPPPPGMGGFDFIRSVRSSAVPLSSVPGGGR